jgi:transposase InsO family protein
LKAAEERVIRKSQRYTGKLLEHGIEISMDGRGRAMDNIFTERLWRTVKYQEVYINDYSSPRVFLPVLNVKEQIAAKQPEQRRF